MLPRVAGSANAETPLLTASTPVIAVQPLANALIRSQRLTDAVAAGKADTGTTWLGMATGSTTVFQTPIANTSPNVTTNR